MNSSGERDGRPGGDKGGRRRPRNGTEPEDAAAPGEVRRPPGEGGPENSVAPQAPVTSDEAGPVEFDEDFVRAASVTEPTARTRELAARWSREGYPEREPWRSDEPPAGWFWSRGRQDSRGRRSRNRRRPWRRKPRDGSE